MGTTDDVLELCEATAGRLAGYLLTSGVERHLVEDVMQETFLVALRKGQEVTSHPNPVALLYRIAQGEAATSRRAASSQKTNELKWHRQQGSRWADPTEHVARDLDLQSALAQLTPRQREVVYLRHCADLPLVDVAEVLGISTRAADTHLQRGKDRLRRSLEAASEVETDASG